MSLNAAPEIPDLGSSGYGAQIAACSAYPTATLGFSATARRKAGHPPLQRSCRLYSAAAGRRGHPRGGKAVGAPRAFQRVRRCNTFFPPSGLPVWPTFIVMSRRVPQRTRMGAVYGFFTRDGRAEPPLSDCLLILFPTPLNADPGGYPQRCRSGRRRSRPAIYGDGPSVRKGRPPRRLPRSTGGFSPMNATSAHSGTDQPYALCLSGPDFPRFRRRHVGESCLDYLQLPPPRERHTCKTVSAAPSNSPRRPARRC
jgi:hypothetical protein